MKLVSTLSIVSGIYIISFVAECSFFWWIEGTKSH